MSWDDVRAGESMWSRRPDRWTAEPSWYAAWAAQEQLDAAWRRLTFH